MVIVRQKLLFFVHIILTAAIFFTIIMCKTAPQEGDDINVNTPEHIYENTDKQTEKEKLTLSEKTEETAIAAGEWSVYAGTDEGLFAVTSNGEKETLWTGGSVKKILNISGENDIWFILTSEGIFSSRDLRNWDKNNRGLPEKTIKVYNNGQKSFVNIIQDIKDLEINPDNPDIMVCATSDRVFLSRNQGQTWSPLNVHTYSSHGIKAAASAFLPELTVFMSHSLYGVHYIQPDIPGSRWVRIQQGLELLETTSYSDEVSDIAVIRRDTDSSSSLPELYFSQTFRRRIYKLNWSNEIKKFDLLWSDESSFGTVDSLFYENNGLNFLYEGNVARLDLDKYTIKEKPDLHAVVKALSSYIKPNCIVIDGPEKIFLSELWLLNEPRNTASNAAAGKEGVYLPADTASDRNSLDSFLEFMNRAGLNMVVIDMKDDEGRLRFRPNNRAISEIGVIANPVNIDSFLAEMKRRGIYTVARIVTFKDRELAVREGGRYSIWDSRNGSPWIGYNNERWVDPFSEEVWEYTAMISEELCARGFDEIQYDYIRFPTDGNNLDSAYYRWQENGMDMESAVISFLRHVRPRVNAPISVDIYGANGWYRTSSRTWQDVELMAPWVDVICPMYYPSHWGQDFMAQSPAEMRPFRIYYTGTLRNDRIARGQVIIRPWAQAFRLNVSYDRQYYNTDYVRRQAEGVRQAGGGGYTYWIMSGKIDDIPLLRHP